MKNVTSHLTALVTALLLILLSSSSAFSIIPTITTDHLNVPRLLTQVSSATLAYVGLVFAFDRPGGRLAVDADACLRVAASQVPNAGLGLYATVSLSEGTTLGTYPGVVRPLNGTLAKLARHPQCGAYAWRFTDNAKIIDPTDEHGNLLDTCYGGSDATPLSNLIMRTVNVAARAPTTLARINEPPIGFDCNVRSSENLETREVLFELSRDVRAGEELFMDYGISYDRSCYGGGSS